MKCLRTLTLTLIALHAISSPSKSEAASAAMINAEVDATFHSFVEQIGGARELANKAAGILVFPSVVKAGMGFGGEYGEGLLLVHKRPAGYYNLISASFGFQLGVQERSVIIMFMTDEALADFDRKGGVEDRGRWDRWQS
jgi:lipid-binding SYLF domain-containing protein